MKAINNYILEKRKNFIREYNKEKTLDLQNLQDVLSEELSKKDFSCFIENADDKIKLDITRNLKEGIMGHIIEDIVASTIEKLNLDFSVKAVKKDGADLIINGEPVEVKAFNKVVRNDGYVEKGISFTDEQMKKEGCAMILVHYIIDETIKVDKVYCRYPDEVLWGDKNITNLNK